MRGCIETLHGLEIAFNISFGLQEKIAVPATPLKRHARNAFIGFTASVVSDTISNSLRVIKTTRQTFPEPISYPNAVND